MININNKKSDLKNSKICDYELFIKRFLTPRLKLEILDTDLIENGSEFHISTMRLKKTKLESVCAGIILLESKSIFLSQRVPSKIRVKLYS